MHSGRTRKEPHRVTQEPVHPAIEPHSLHEQPEVPMNRQKQQQAPNPYGPVHGHNKWDMYEAKANVAAKGRMEAARQKDG